MRNKIIILFLFLSSVIFGQVPNTNTFSLTDVQTELELSSTTSLVNCFSNALDGGFNPSYKGSKDRLSNFRNYGHSIDGKYQSAVTQTSGSILGYIRVSSDYGLTWASKGVSNNYYDIAVSATGKYQTAIVWWGNIYTSSDYGLTWTARTSTPAYRQSISMSSNGKYQTTTISDGYIYVSVNYGVTWTQISLSKDWSALSLSSSGKYQSACVGSGYIYVSSDYGSNWTEKGNSRDWQGISVSATGEYQTAVVNSSYIYISSNYGSTWTQKGLSKLWTDVSVSSTGKYQTAVCFGYIYVSSDYGSIWVAKGLSKNYFSVSISATGKYQTAIVNSGYIYVSSDYGANWTSKNSIRYWESVSVSSYAMILEATCNPTSLPATLGTATVSVVTGSTDVGSNSWSASITSSSSWLTIINGNTGRDNDTFTLSYVANNTGMPRVADIKITSDFAPDFQFGIIQAKAAAD